MPRQLTANRTYDVRSSNLPGNTLIDAIFNRRLMSWSDRGGASMLLGDGWAEHCNAYLDSAIGRDIPVPGDRPFQLRSFLRLDDNPEIEREVNLNQLPNPDFLLIGMHHDGGPLVQAADAKFAADRIKPGQVSVEVVADLLHKPESGATRTLLKSQIGAFDLSDALVVPGLFICPDTPFTDALLDHSKRTRRCQIDDVLQDILVRIPADPATLFDSARPARLIPTLARLDMLPVSPRENLLATVYYLRVACACFHLWDEQTRPLFGAPNDADSPAAAIVAGEVARRASDATSAYGLLVAWHRDLRKVIFARKAVADAISLPVGVDEIRAKVGDVPRPQANIEVRRIRSMLERSYRDSLLDHLGAIYSDDSRSVKRIVKEIRNCSREIRADLLDELAAYESV